MDVPPIESTPPIHAPQRRGKWIAAVTCIVLGIGGLAAWAIATPGAISYYKTPSELSAADVTKQLRIGGRVVDDSLRRDGRVVSFDVTDGKDTITVEYRGEVPDTLKNGTDVVAEGRYAGGQNAFAADRVLAKCSSKYVPAERPGDLGKA